MDRDGADYSVNLIDRKDELKNCPVFHITKYNWGGEYRPVTYGQLAVLRDQGFVLRMVCEEKPPQCVTVERGGPVWEDSAMEFFLQLFPGKRTEAKPLPYLNFEVNAAGILHTGVGVGRSGRTPLPEALYQAVDCSVIREEHDWILELFVPFTVTDAVYDTPTQLHSGDCFACNFYKISEKQEPVHFGSFTEIRTVSPDFHRPEFFARATIQ